MAWVKATPEMLAKAVQETDWARVDAMTDEDIARQVAGNPDAAPLLTDVEAAVAMIRGMRKRLGLSQAAFAVAFRIPVGTLRDWEQGRKRPDATAQTYLRVIAREPAAVVRALKPAA